MTWDELVDEWRVKLQEARSDIKMLQDALVILADDDEGPNKGETVLLLVTLTGAVGQIHGACGSIAVAVDALATMVRVLNAEKEARDKEESPF